MENRCELVSTGIKCDNVECGWRDDNVNSDDYEQWINKPCPNCGENLLTEEDYNLCQSMHLAADFLNTMSEEDLKELVEGFDIEDLKSLPILKDAKGLENLDNAESLVHVIFETHKEIKATEIIKI